MNLHKSFILVAVICAANSAFALSHPFQGSRFGAPEYDGYVNLSEPDHGDIVLDTATGNFMGYSWNGTTGAWVVLSGAAVKAPTRQMFTSGSGTYTSPTSPTPLYIKVRMIGAGGGGSGGGSGTPGPGTSGTSTNFGTLSAGGGGQGAGSGGSPVGTSPGDIAINGQNGNSWKMSATSGIAQAGTDGASSMLGTGGFSTGVYAVGGAATGYGAGGAGGGCNVGLNPGLGAGAGAYIEKQLTPGSYSYSVGTAGNGGAAGTSGQAGGGGAPGVIIVDEYYQ